MPKGTNVRPTGSYGGSLIREPSLKEKLTDSIDTMTAAKTYKILESDAPQGVSPTPDAFGQGAVNAVGAMSNMTQVVTGTFKGLADTSLAAASSEREARHAVEERLEREQLHRRALILDERKEMAEQTQASLEVQQQHHSETLAMFRDLMGMKESQHTADLTREKEIAAMREEHTSKLYDIILNQKDARITKLEWDLQHQEPSIEERLMRDYIDRHGGSLFTALQALTGGQTPRDPEAEYKMLQVDKLRMDLTQQAAASAQEIKDNSHVKASMSNALNKFGGIIEQVGSQVLGLPLGDQPNDLGDMPPIEANPGEDPGEHPGEDA